MKRLKIRKILPLWILIILLFTSYSALAQQNIKTGVVTNSNGKPLSDIRIKIVENPNIETKTDEEGRYSIKGNVGQYIELKNSYQKRKVVPIKSKNQQITFDDESDRINTGYGLSIDKRYLTGAVDIVESSELTQSKNIINPANALYGKSVGLQVLENAGEPPTSPNMFIRGRETFRNSSPLVLVDGFEQPFEALSMKEIASITVLKDASSLALYGQRGANGVILINTKRGNEQSLSVNASVEQGITQPKETPGFLQSYEYAQAVNEARLNDGLSQRYSSNEIDQYRSGDHPYLYPNVNWGDEIMRNFGTRTNYNITFEGGGETARYFALVNYVRDSGIYSETNPTEDYDTQLKHGKFNFRSNLDIDVTDQLLFKLDVSGNLVENKAPGGGGSSSDIFNAIYSIPSASFPVRTTDGSWGGTPIYGNNPMAILTSTGIGKPNEREVSLGGTLRQDLNQLTKGLSAEASVRYNNYNRYTEGQSREFSYKYLNPVLDNNGNVIDTSSTVYGQDTDLNFYGGLNRQIKQYDILGKVNYERKLQNSSLKWILLFHQLERSLTGQNNTYHRQNFATNIHYGISDKYFISLAGSYSGYNVLPPEDRFGFFPAVSAGWLVSNEEFMKSADFLDLLKIRVSWGKSGYGGEDLPNTNIYRSAYDYGSGYWLQNGNNSRGGFEEERLASSRFTHSTSTKTNVGLDASFFQKLDISVDLFYSKRNDILTGTGGRYSQIIGINAPMSSDGIVENRGVEATLNWKDRVGKIGYYIAGNFSFTRNKIENINEQYRPYSYLKRTGRRVGQYFGLEALGFFEDQADIDSSPTQTFGEVRPGDIKYKDQNDDGIINEYDEVPIGYAGGYPEIYFSFSLGANYRGLGISAHFQGTGHHSAILNTQSVFWPLRNNQNISNYYYNRRWTPQTTSSASYPRLTTEDNNNNFRSNTLWLEDRSYIKLRNLEISYDFPQALINSWKLNNLSIYLIGRNLFSIDSIPVMDPEQFSVGYPLLRTYQLGLEVEF